MQRAHELLRAGQAEEAAAHFRRALEFEPNNDAATIGLAYSLKRLGSLDEGLALFERVVAGNPAHRGALVGLGYTRREVGDDAGALEALTRASLLDPADVALAVEAGTIASRLGRTGEALAAFERALASEPLGFTANVSLARLLKTLGRNAEALKRFETALSAEPGHKGVRIERAHLLRDLGRLEEAAAACRAVLADDASYSAASIALGWTLRKLGRLPEAEAAFREVLKREPRHLGALTAIGHIVSDSARVEEASALFAEAIRADPLDASLRLSFGHIARRRRDREGALASFAVAAVLDPARLEPLFDIATELRDLGRPEEAHAVLDAVEARAKAEAGPRVTMARALILRSEQRREAALEAFLSIGEDTPQRGKALVEAARECQALGRPAEAKGLIDQALSHTPDEPGALLALVDFALAAEDFAEVRALCRRGLDVAPDQIWFHLNAARAAAGLGDMAQAHALLEAARERFAEPAELIATEVEIARHRRDFAGAQRRLEAASAVVGQSFWLWAQRTGLAIALGAFDEAAAALAASPAVTRTERARTAVLRGQLREAQRDYQAAIAAYRQAIALDPGDGWSFAELARALMLSLDIEGAREALRRSVELNRSVNLLRGISTNPSQTHLGQLLDDFALDGALLEELKGTAALPGANRLAALGRIIRAAPHSTAAALAGAIALRQGGHLAACQGTSAARAIPRRIVQFWSSGEPPDDIRALMASWPALNGGCAYALFDDERAYRFLRAKFPAQIARAFARSRSPAQRADLFRLAALSEGGGFYADADDRALAPIDSFAPGGAELLLYQENYGSVANNLLGAVPAHPVIARALEDAAAAINRGDKDIVWLSTGPGLLTRAFAAHVFASDRIEAALERICVLELGEMQRSVGLHCPVRYKATDRHWMKAAFARPAGRPVRGARAGPALPPRASPTRPALQRS